MNTVEFPQSRCRVGVARADITPPVGIYHRMWGAAAHDRSTGIHRPLTATVLTLAPVRSVDDSPLTVFVALDHVLLWHNEMTAFLDRVSEQTGVDRDRITVFFSHTHAAGLMGLERSELPGGDLISEYLATLAEAVSGCVTEARAGMSDCLLSWTTGRCSLATNRDYFDEQRQQSVCGFNPSGFADDSAVVVRVISEATGQTTATLVNYACHPTTLAWDNTLISPDYVGAMRDVIETQTQAPCFFIQGASGDIGPRDGFVGDTEVADRNGRQLGFAVLSALESLPPSGTRMKYAGAVLSGATIGTWRHVPIDEGRSVELERWHETHRTIDIPYRDDLFDRDGLQASIDGWQRKERQSRQAGDSDAAGEARAMIERATRRLTRLEQFPPGDTYPFRFQVWRLGDAVVLALDGEHYNVLQRELRARFPDTPIIVATLANGSDAWYLPDADSFGKGLYQEEASVLARGCLETVTEEAAKAIETLLSSET